MQYNIICRFRNIVSSGKIVFHLKKTWDDCSKIQSMSISNMFFLIIYWLHISQDIYLNFRNLGMSVSLFVFLLLLWSISFRIFLFEVASSFTTLCFKVMKYAELYHSIWFLLSSSMVFWWSIQNISAFGGESIGRNIYVLDNQTQKLLGGVLNLEKMLKYTSV